MGWEQGRSARYERPLYGRQEEQETQVRTLESLVSHQEEGRVHWSLWRVRDKITFIFPILASCREEVLDLRNKEYPDFKGYVGLRSGSNKGHQVVDPNRRLEATRVPVSLLLPYRQVFVQRPLLNQVIDPKPGCPHQHPCLWLNP